MPLKRLAIIGNYGATNVGDEAVLAGLLILASTRHADQEVTVLSYDPARTGKEHGCRSTPLLPFGLRSFLRFDWWRTLRILSCADEVWVGGGALFTDEKLFAVFLWGWHAFWSRLLAGKVSLVANTVGPIRTPLGKLLMRLILRLIDTASVRDVESEKVLRSLGFTHRVTVGADPAFLIEPVVGERTHQKTIIVSLRPWIRETPNLLHDLALWIDEREQDGYHIVLLPFQTMHDDDRIVLGQLFTLVHDREGVELVDHAEDLPSIMRRIASSDLVVGMRLHSLILSAIEGTPFIGLSYSDKVANFCRSVGRESGCIDLRHWDYQVFTRTVSSLLQDPDKIATQLKGKLANMRQAALLVSPEA